MQRRSTERRCRSTEPAVTGSNWILQKPTSGSEHTPCVRRDEFRDLGGERR